MYSYNVVTTSLATESGYTLVSHAGYRSVSRYHYLIGHSCFLVGPFSSTLSVTDREGLLRKTCGHFDLGLVGVITPLSIAVVLGGFTLKVCVPSALSTSLTE